MGLVIGFVVLLVVLVASAWSCARSYYERGRRRGLQQATAEIVRGAQAHLGTKDCAVPKPVRRSMARQTRVLENNMPHEPALWDFGHAVGEACWRNGFDEGLRVHARPDDRIRLDITLGELLQMSWLAHLGFQHMMPNYRGFEVHRFSGEQDAREAARAVAVLECALPRSERPFADIKSQITGRDTLITDWWTVVPERRTA